MKVVLALPFAAITIVTAIAGLTGQAEDGLDQESLQKASIYLLLLGVACPLGWIFHEDVENSGLPGLIRAPLMIACFLLSTVGILIAAGLTVAVYAYLG